MSKSLRNESKSSESPVAAFVVTFAVAFGASGFLVSVTGVFTIFPIWSPGLLYWFKIFWTFDGSSSSHGL